MVEFIRKTVGINKIRTSRVVMMLMGSLFLCTSFSFAIGSYGVDLSHTAYQTNLNPFYASGYGGAVSDGSGGQCTWYAWGRAYEKSGNITLPCRGHATHWTDEAAKAGYYTGTTAKANSIMVQHFGEVGHVFFVEKVENGNAYVTEANWTGDGHWNGIYHEDVINLATMKRMSTGSTLVGGVDYIYLCIEHEWDKGKTTIIAKCTKNSLVNGEKVYTCTVCGEKKTEVIKAAHSYKTTKTRKATLKKNGSISKRCTKCGKTTSTAILRPKTIRMKRSLVAYNGKAQKPQIVIKDIKGKTISRGIYSVSYLNNKKIGTATAIVKFKGNYSGTKKLSFKVGPKGTTITKITGGKKKITLKWARKSGINGYKIQYSTRKDFKNAKTITIKGNKKSVRAIGKLKNGTTYYVRVRTYKTIKKKTHYSPWSEIRSAKTSVVTERTKALNAYKSFLEKKDNAYLESFATRDLNRDGIPELITLGGGQINYVNIFTYKNGKVENVHWGSSFEIYSNDLVRVTFSSGSGYWADSYYKVGNKLKFEYVYRYAEWLYDDPETYSQGEKAYEEDSPKVPYSEIQKNLSQVLNGATIVKLKYYPNTSKYRQMLSNM